MLAKKENVVNFLFVSIIFIPLQCRERKKIEISGYHFTISIDDIFTFLFSQNLQLCMQIVCYKIYQQLCNINITI